jgi:DnaJ-domain-containing protein 1
LLDLEFGFALNPKTLEQNLFQASLKWHPDRFALASPEERLLAEDQMAAINEAHDLLIDPLSRAEFLLATFPEDPDGQEQRNSDPEFLMEMMELRETVEVAIKGGSSDETCQLHMDLTRKESKILAKFGEYWENLQSPPKKSELAALKHLCEHARYLRSALLQLQQPLFNPALIRRDD